MASTRELHTIEKYASTLKEAIVFCESIPAFSDKLVEKDFISRQGQNDILQNVSLPPLEKSGRLVDAVVFQVKLNSEKFDALIEILSGQPPLTSLVDQIKKHHAQCRIPPTPPSRQGSQSSSDTDSTVDDFTADSLEEKWAVLIADLTESLGNHGNALKRMKIALQQRVQSKSIRKLDRKLKKRFNPLVDSPEFKNAKTVDQLFTLLAPFWNWRECRLLEFLVKVSGCKPAIKRFHEFIQTRKEAAPHIVLQLSDTDQANPQQPPSFLPLSPLSMESCSGDLSVSQGMVEVVMKVKRDVLTLKDYDTNASLLCRTVRISRHDLTLLGTGTGCIAIRWCILSDLANAVQSTTVSSTLLRELAQHGIAHIRIGSGFQLDVATVDYWGGEMRGSQDLERAVLLRQQGKAELQRQVVSLQQDNAKLKKHVALLHSDNAKLALKGQVASQHSDIAKLKGQVASLHSDNAELKGQVASLHSDNAKLKGQVTSLQHDKTRLLVETAFLQQDDDDELKETLVSLHQRNVQLQQQQQDSRKQVTSLKQNADRLQAELIESQQHNCWLEQQSTTMAQELAELRSDMQIVLVQKDSIELECMKLQGELQARDAEVEKLQNQLLMSGVQKQEQLQQRRQKLQAAGAHEKLQQGMAIMEYTQREVERLEQPLKLKQRMLGQFHCKNCNRTWLSSNAREGMRLECVKCKTMCQPVSPRV